MQNKKRMVVTKPKQPVATALVKMPLAAITLLGSSVKTGAGLMKAGEPYLAFLVSSAMCPDASKPVMVPAAKSLASACQSHHPTKTSRLRSHSQG